MQQDNNNIDSSTNKKQRPRIVHSNTWKIECGCGHIYVTVGKVDGETFEVFAALGRAGGCAYSQNEALCRSISEGLRRGVPASAYINQLSKIKCPSIGYDNGVQIFSCADAISKALEMEE